MKMRLKTLLNQLYKELSHNIKDIEECEELYRKAISINDYDSAYYYNVRSSVLDEEGNRILITINEIEKRVSY